MMNIYLKEHRSGTSQDLEEEVKSERQSQSSISPPLEVYSTKRSTTSQGNWKEENVRMAIERAWERSDYEMVISLIQRNNFNDGQELIDLWDQAHYCIAEKKKNRTLTSLERFRIRQKNLPPENICPSRKRRKISHSKESVQILNSWLEDNFHYPYPGREVLEDLCERSGLSDKQVKTWFANARRKLKDPGCYKQHQDVESSFVDDLDNTKDAQSISSDISCTTDDSPCLEGQMLTYGQKTVRGHLEAHVVPSFTELAEPRVNIVPPLKLPHGMNNGRTSVMLSWFREGYSNPPSMLPRYFNFGTPLQAFGSIESSSNICVQSWISDLTLPSSWMKQLCPNKTIVYGEDIVRNAARILLHLAGKDKESSHSTPVIDLT